ncbi:GNAT family N-acetyltransferase [Salininema proteolyticum]|uniref:GNAT family N-acetyltransferase n=1 Tax=Salininema proteolyticum TaxID=1607685 RepID=A0ABV8TUP3_9ACTN
MTISLTPLTTADLEAHLAGEDDQIVRWLSQAPATREGLRAYLADCERRWAEEAEVRNFGIRHGAEETLVGSVDVQFGLPFLGEGEANIAYCVYPPWRGRGIATAAVLLACDWAGAHGASGAVIRSHPDNEASAGVALRAGFRPGGVDDEGPEGPLRWFRRDLGR